MSRVSDNVNHPPHYNWLSKGIEAVDVCEQFNYNLGNALKYIIRCDHKGKPEEDIRKAIFYLNRELQRREALSESRTVPSDRLSTGGEDCPGNCVCISSDMQRDVAAVSLDHRL